jgi:hypothetical protein
VAIGWIRLQAGQKCAPADSALQYIQFEFSIACTMPRLSRDFNRPCRKIFYIGQKNDG